MQAVAESQEKEPASDDVFWIGVLAADSGHAITALVGGKNVGHSEGQSTLRNRTNRTLMA
jgi:hypothetical protein